MDKVQFQRAKVLAKQTLPSSILHREMTEQEVQMGGDIVVSYYKLLMKGFSPEEMLPKLTEVRTLANGSIATQLFLVGKVLDKVEAAVD